MLSINAIGTAQRMRRRNERVNNNHVPNNQQHTGEQMLRLNVYSNLKHIHAVCMHAFSMPFCRFNGLTTNILAKNIHGRKKSNCPI